MTFSEALARFEILFTIEKINTERGGGGVGALTKGIGSDSEYFVLL